MAKKDAYNTPTSSALGALTITPHNTNVLAKMCKGLYVGVAGNVAVRMADGTLPIFVGVPAGAILPIQFDKVLVTGTTATTMIGLY
jgi:hypothetical protein